METILIEILRTAPTTGLILVMLWYGQSRILEALTKVTRRMDCFEQSQHACQLDNVRVFATRSEMEAVERDVSEHDRRITRLEAKP